MEQPCIKSIYTPKNKHGTWKWTLGKGDSYWKPSFPGSMLNFRGVGVFFKQWASLSIYTYTYHGHSHTRNETFHAPPKKSTAKQRRCFRHRPVGPCHLGWNTSTDRVKKPSYPFIRPFISASISSKSSRGPDSNPVRYQDFSEIAKRFQLCAITPWK